MNPKIPTLLCVAAVLAGAPAASAQVASTEYDGAAALGLALRRLGPTQRVLMIAAHPDDENTSVLSTLALGHGADVAYLALTRGDGGQNAIGPELQEAIGLIRSEELLAARRLDGARQFFTRAYDYGFSKSAAEAFQHWPKDSVLADVVAVIRRFRPDIVVSVFTGTPRDGHGQHQAAGILAREAFTAAGDPSRFPAQIAHGLRPHRPAKLYQSLWRGTPAGAVPLETGTYDPLLGRSYHQIAMASRSRHRSQQMGRTYPPGPQQVALNRVDVEAPGEASIFAGVDTTLSARARSLGAAPDLLRTLEAYDAAVARARGGFNPLEPGAIVPDLAEALELVDRAAAALAGRDGDAATELRFHVEAERADVRAALALAAGVVVGAVA
ncbi:MAG TPA: PIG-L family deacetylase, partial [Longimicrobiales bacterium]